MVPGRVNEGSREYVGKKKNLFIRPRRAQRKIKEALRKSL